MNKISDQAFLQYLFKYQQSEYFKLPKGAAYQLELDSAPNPTKRMRFNIRFFSDDWKKDHSCPAQLAMEFLDLYNSGMKDPADYRNKTGRKSRSRRGNYLLPVLQKIEATLETY